jgi:hypothetical protein
VYLGPYAFVHAFAGVRGGRIVADKMDIGRISVSAPSRPHLLLDLESVADLVQTHKSRWLGDIDAPECDHGKIVALAGP